MLFHRYYIDTWILIIKKAPRRQSQWLSLLSPPLFLKELLRPSLAPSTRPCIGNSVYNAPVASETSAFRETTVSAKKRHGPVEQGRRKWQHRNFKVYILYILKTITQKVQDSTFSSFMVKQFGFPKDGVDSEGWNLPNAKKSSLARLVFCSGAEDLERRRGYKDLPLRSQGLRWSACWYLFYNVLCANLDLHVYLRNVQIHYISLLESIRYASLL